MRNVYEKVARVCGAAGVGVKGSDAIGCRLTTLRTDVLFLLVSASPGTWK